MNCPECDGAGSLDTHVHGTVECYACDGSGVDLSSRRERLKQAMDLIDPLQEPGCGLSAADVQDQITAGFRSAPETPA